jgi:hypothetical protein
MTARPLPVRYRIASSVFSEPGLEAEQPGHRVRLMCRHRTASCGTLVA